MWTSLSALAQLPAATRVYCGHEYTLANLRFALAVEPGNAEISQRARRASRRSATAGEPTLPSTIGSRARDQSVPARAVAGGEGRCGAHAGRALANDVEAFAALRAWKNGF